MAQDNEAVGPSEYLRLAACCSLDHRGLLWAPRLMLQLNQELGPRKTLQVDLNKSDLNQAAHTLAAKRSSKEQEQEVTLG